MATPSPIVSIPPAPPIVDHVISFATNIDPELVKQLSKTIVDTPGLSTAITVIKAAMAAVEQVSSIPGSSKIDYVVAVLSSLCSDKLLPTNISDPLETMIANGIVADTVQFAIDASKGGLTFFSVDKAIAVAEDVVKIAEDAAAPLFGLCCSFKRK